MPDQPPVSEYRALLARLLAGPAPRGQEFDLCRAVITRAPGAVEAATATRALLEGAMADAHTDIADAQLIMALLKAIDRGEVSLQTLVVHRGTQTGVAEI